MCGGNFGDFFVRPDRWLREHRDEAKTGAAAAALIATAIYAPELYAAYGGAGAAGAGAAAGGTIAAEDAALGAAMTGLGAEGAGAAAGAGAAGAADYAALSGMEGGALGGQTALDAMPAYAALDAAPTGGLLGADPMAIGGGPMGTASGNPLEAWGNVDPHALENGVPDFNSFGAQADLNLAKLQGFLRGDNATKGLKALNTANQFARLAQPAPLQSATHRPPAYQGGGGADLTAMHALLSNPAGAERLKYLLRARGIQV